MKEEKRTIYRRRNIGFIFQSFQLVSELNVEQNIIFPLLLDYQKPDPKKVNEILNLLGLTERRYHLPSQLSGGQQQRVAIGRALITQPKLILADEPTGNLDSKNSQDVIDMLISASRRFKQTILMITHNNNLTSSVDRVFRVSDGILTDLGGTANECIILNLSLYRPNPPQAKQNDPYLYYSCGCFGCCHVLVLADMYFTGGYATRNREKRKLALCVS